MLQWAALSPQSFRSLVCNMLLGGFPPFDYGFQIDLLVSVTHGTVLARSDGLMKSIKDSNGFNSLRCQTPAHEALAEILMHMAHKILNTSGVLKLSCD